MPTGKPETSLATLPDNTDAMLVRVGEAIEVGKFPGKDMTALQKANLVKLALYYRLDPLAGEIMPYQGNPYITILGRRRLDTRAGNAVDIQIKPMDRDSYAAYVEMEAIKKGDIVVIGTFIDKKTGAKVETTGRVLVEEKTLREWTTKDGQKKSNEYLPVVKFPLEMAWKRCEARGRNMLYGPVTDPGNFGFVVQEEPYEPDGPVIDHVTGEIIESHQPAISAPSAIRVEESLKERVEKQGVAWDEFLSVLGIPEWSEWEGTPRAAWDVYQHHLVESFKGRLEIDGIAWDDFLSGLGIAEWREWTGTEAAALDAYHEHLMQFEDVNPQQSVDIDYAEAPTETAQSPLL